MDRQFAPCLGKSFLGCSMPFLLLLPSCSVLILCLDCTRLALLFGLGHLGASSCVLLPHLVALEMEVPPATPTNATEPMLGPRVTCASRRVRFCVCESQPGALSPSPELLHCAEGKVDNLGVVGSLRIQQHSCIQTRWGSDQGILALLSSQCLKLPCIVCPMLRASPQH